MTTTDSILLHGRDKRPLGKVMNIDIFRFLRGNCGECAHVGTVRAHVRYVCTNYPKAGYNGLCTPTLTAPRYVPVARVHGRDYVLHYQTSAQAFPREYELYHGIRLPSSEELPSKCECCGRGLSLQQWSEQEPEGGGLRFDF